MKLNNYELDLLKARYPSFELSYESILHNKVPSEYNILLYIPAGKKYIAWFSFYKYKNVLYLMELNKDKSIINAKIVNCDFDHQLCIGTIFYGTYLDEQNIFVIEDIHYFKGISLKQTTFGERLLYIQDCFQKYMTRTPNKLNFALPIIKRSHEDKIKTVYNTHHVQYRSLDRILPFLNEQATKMIEVKNKPVTQTFTLYKPITPDIKKPQYKQKTVFLVRADIQFDIYRLYVYGKNNTSIYYNVAYIPDYKTSVFMNSIFRNIKENRNLDAIEESDDEEEFENIKEDRFVDLQKIVQMECEFHFKFKKWIPKRIVKHQKIVHINQLQLQFHNEQKKQYSISHTKHKIYQKSYCK
jgi:hypothetical protein